MPKSRVLIVDDSVVIRSIISKILEAEEDFEVAGVAANGKIALEKIAQVNPDIVTLDIEMPVLSGLDTLSKIRESYATLPVVMFSSLTERGAAESIEALSRGASDYATKPSNVSSVDEGIEEIRTQLVPKLKALCRAPKPEATTAPQKIATPRRASIKRALGVPGRVDLLAIGVSTGGPKALDVVLPSLPADFPVPVVVTQHMPPNFTRFLAERLDLHCNLDVVEAEAGQILHPGGIWIAPGDYHMVFEMTGDGVQVVLNQEPPENSCRPAVDVMFRSAVEVYGASVMGVILTGMGQDGLRGCEWIREKGGPIFAQDEETSVVWGMPGFVAEAGLADKVLPLPMIGPEVVRRVAKGRPAIPKRDPSNAVEAAAGAE